jgi:hypothetical protein
MGGGTRPEPKVMATQKRAGIPGADRFVATVQQVIAF